MELLLLGRLLVGLASGLTTGVIPMYLAEVSPIKLRGAMGVLCPLGLTTGVVVAQVASLEQALGTEEHWHYALGCFAVLNLFCYAFYFWIPESPKYLYSVKGDQAGSLRAIRKLFGRHTIGDDYIKLQMECANGQNGPSAQEDGQPQANRSLWSVVRDPTLTLPLVLVCALQGGQQLSGINAVRIAHPFWRCPWQIIKCWLVPFPTSRCFSIQCLFLNRLDLARRQPSLLIWVLAA